MVGPVRDTDPGGTEGRERSAMVRVARRGPKSGVERVTEHRSRQSAGGAQRVELTVPTEHVKLIRAVAKMLRASDAGNDEVLALQRIVGPEQRPTRTGAELRRLRWSARTWTFDARTRPVVPSICPDGASARHQRHRRTGGAFAPRRCWPAALAPGDSGKDGRGSRQPPRHRRALLDYSERCAPAQRRLEERDRGVVRVRSKAHRDRR